MREALDVFGYGFLSRWREVLMHDLVFRTIHIKINICTSQWPLNKGRIRPHCKGSGMALEPLRFGERESTVWSG